MLFRLWICCVMSSNPNLFFSFYVLCISRRCPMLLPTRLFSYPTMHRWILTRSDIARGRSHPSPCSSTCVQASLTANQGPYTIQVISLVFQTRLSWARDGTDACGMDIIKSLISNPTNLCTKKLSKQKIKGLYTFIDLTYVWPSYLDPPYLSRFETNTTIHMFVNCG